MLGCAAQQPEGMEDEFARGSVEGLGAGWVSVQEVVPPSVLSDGASQLVALGEVGKLELSRCCESVKRLELGWGLRSPYSPFWVEAVGLRGPL